MKKLLFVLSAILVLIVNFFEGWLTIKKIIVGLIVAVIAGHYIFSPSLDYTYSGPELPGTFDEFYQGKLKKSVELNVRPGNEEKLVRIKAGKTPYAFLYIHGFKACRAEGEIVVDRLAREYGANTYYLRLPGHGTNKDDHAKTRFYHHLDEVNTALRMMEKLGDKIIVFGTSMGGILATYLAAEYPEKIEAVVLVSPFFSFADPVANKLTFYPLYALMKRVMPVIKDTSPIPEEKDNWTGYWYKVIRAEGLRQILDLKRKLAVPEIWEKVDVPVLMVYYYKDEKHQDPSALVSAMEEAYSHFGTASKPNPLNRKVAISTGPVAHVLMSKYVEADHKAVSNAVRTFLDRVTGRK